jgi:hypothetical protein
VSPRRERRKIEEAEVDRLLDLVRVASGQKYAGNVRFQPLDARAARPEDGRMRERRQQPRLIRPGFDGGRGPLWRHAVEDAWRHPCA